MRILHVIASLAPRYGGPSRACPELCRALVRQGDDVAIYTTDVDGPGRRPVATDAPIDLDGVRLRVFPVERPWAWKRSWPLHRALGATVSGFDVVHVHSLYLFPSASAAWHARRAGVPYLVRPHGTLDPSLLRRHRTRKWLYGRLIEGRNLDRAAAIHYTTDAEAALAAPLGLAAPAVVVPNGVELERFERLPARGAFRARHPSIGERAIVLHFGRLHARKGLDLLVAAFVRRIRERDDCHLVLAGPDDGWADAARARLASAGCLDRTTFTGLLDDADGLACLRDADVFVLASAGENFGLAVAEAMAAGLPVVISDRVNLADAVRAAGAGVVVERSADAVHAALARLLDDPGAARAMAERGRRLVRERYGWDAVATQMRAVYARIAAAPEWRLAASA